MDRFQIVALPGAPFQGLFDQAPEAAGRLAEAAISSVTGGSRPVAAG